MMAIIKDTNVAVRIVDIHQMNNATYILVANAAGEMSHYRTEALLYVDDEITRERIATAVLPALIRIPNEYGNLPTDYQAVERAVMLADALIKELQK